MLFLKFPFWHKQKVMRRGTDDCCSNLRFGREGQCCSHIGQRSWGSMGSDFIFSEAIALTWELTANTVPCETA